MARLRKDYLRASVIFDAARARFQQRIGICPRSEFIVLSDALDWASDELDRARAALDAHIREHCCVVQVNAAPQD
jgi:hypothetical protein